MTSSIEHDPSDLKKTNSKIIALRDAFETLDSQESLVTTLFQQWQEFEDSFSAVQEMVGPQQRDLEVKEKELELKEKKLVSWQKQLESLKEELELKQIQLDISGEVLQSKRKSLEALEMDVELRTKRLDFWENDLELKQKQLLELTTSVDYRLRVDESIDEQMDIAGEVTVESKPGNETTLDDKEATCLSLAMRMDGKGLQRFLNDQFDEHKSLCDKLCEAFMKVKQPARLVLEAVDGFFTPHLTNGAEEYETGIVRSSCLLMLEQLLRAKPVIAKPVRVEARELGKRWLKKIREGGGCFLAVLSFLLLVVTYDISSCFDMGALKRFLSLVQQDRRASLVQQHLGPPVNKDTKTRRYFCKSCRKNHPGVDCNGQAVRCRHCKKMGHRAFECFSNPARTGPPSKSQGKSHALHIGAPSTSQGRGDHDGASSGQSILNVLGREDADTSAQPIAGTKAERKAEKKKCAQYAKVGSICANMQVDLFKNFLCHNWLTRELSSWAIRSAFNPGKLVFDVTLSFGTKPSDKYQCDKYRENCISLLEILADLSSKLNESIRTDALGLARSWKVRLEDSCNKEPLDVYGLLQFMITYKLTYSFSANELIELYKTFYEGPVVYKHEKMASLCRDLGLTDKIPGVVQTLIDDNQHICAVKYICLLGLANDFSPTLLLKDYLDDIRKTVDDKKNKGTYTEQIGAIVEEYEALQVIIKCITFLNLGSKFPASDLSKRCNLLLEEKKEVSKSHQSKVDHPTSTSEPNKPEPKCVNKRCNLLLEEKKELSKSHQSKAEHPTSTAEPNKPEHGTKRPSADVVSCSDQPTDHSPEKRQRVPIQEQLQSYPQPQPHQLLLHTDPTSSRTAVPNEEPGSHPFVEPGSHSQGPLVNLGHERPYGSIGPHMGGFGPPRAGGEPWGMDHPPHGLIGSHMGGFGPHPGAGGEPLPGHWGMDHPRHPLGPQSDYGMDRVGPRSDYGMDRVGPWSDYGMDRVGPVTGYYDRPHHPHFHPDPDPHTDTYYAPRYGFGHCFPPNE